MAEKIIMPQAGQDITEGRVVKWLKAEGATVKKDEAICEVETEKVVFEVESPGDGVLYKIIVPAGEKVKIFATIGILAAPGEIVDVEAFLEDEQEDKKEVDVSDIRKKLGKKSEADTGRIRISGRARKLTEKLGVDPATIEGTGPKGRIIEKDVEKAAEGRSEAEVKMSPTAKKMAEAHGIRTEELTGSGPGGRIVKADVQKAIEGTPKEKVPTTKGPRLVKAVEPIRGVRRVIFERMYASLQQMAQLTITMEVDAAELVRFRRVLGEGPEDERIRVSYNAVILKILARVLEEHPNVNASVMEDEIYLWESVNLGVAVDMEEGLMVPVIRDANKKNVMTIQKELDDLAARARSKKLMPDDLQGGTFTLTNLGFLDVEGFTPIINPPESAILGVGSIVDKPVVEQGEIRPGKRMMLSLSFDHRIIDGADAGRFLKRVKAYIEKPYLLQASPAG
ncbi:MAG: dihydrolipoamide acetyltransferase family protein [Desulfobacteraceae bacterium]